LLKIAHPEEGSTVKVGTILAWIGEPGEAIADGEMIIKDEYQSGKLVAINSPNFSHTPVEDQSSSIPHQDNLRVKPQRKSGFISPVVAKIAAENKVNLDLVQGTGLNGRITKKDILAYLESFGKDPIKDQVEILTPQNISDRSSIIPHSTMRKRIAEHMVLSKRTSPHVTTVFEADMSKIVDHRELYKETFAKDDAKLTFTAYFVAAIAAALRDFPLVNSSWTEDGIVVHNDINIGMATSLGEQGLIVPVIKHANNLSLLGIARVVNDLADRARGKKLQPDEVTGGTFTISNHGVSGSLFATPIINQPQCGILGVGKLQKRLIVLEDSAGYDTISIRPMVYLTLTFDHRILDGAIADYFLSKVVETLEKWT
jgi:2-oxoglutarate dehydrogenase E2 component (dihydrolipoamide succinyltransferase)